MFGFLKWKFKEMNGVVPWNDGALKILTSTLRCFDEYTMNLIPGHSVSAPDFV